MPIAELLRQGNLGVGTLDHLDGELVVLDGKAYQIRGDGKILDVPPDRSTPFAVVANFEPVNEFACPPVASLADLDQRLDTEMGRRNHFAAIRIEGRFASLTMRSVARQEPPYKPLDEVARGQTVWTKVNQVGTLVGVRSPDWTKGLNVPGYHWHFLSADRQTGGHVLDCEVEAGRVCYDVFHDWTVKLEDSDGFQTADLVKDRSHETRQVESSRGTKPE